MTTMKNYKPFAWAIGVVGVVASVMYYEAKVAPTRVDDELKRVEMEMMRVEMEKKRAEIDMIRTRPQYELNVQDLNGNGLPEKFYEINGKRFFLEIDGKNLEDTLKQ